MKKVSLKKVADLDKVVKLCDALGSNYTPGNEVLMPTALASLLVVTNEKMKAVNSANVAAATLSKQRKLSFAGIPSLAAKIVRRIMSSQATLAEQLQAREIKRKYFHGRTSVKKSEASSADGGVPAAKLSRSNYRDYASQLAGLEQLIHLVSTISGYKSVEPALTLEGLNQTFAELQGIHVAAINARMTLTEARKSRDEIVSAPGGVSATVKAFKDYLRSKYGYGDPTLQQL